MFTLRRANFLCYSFMYVLICKCQREVEASPRASEEKREVRLCETCSSLALVSHL
jgi:hypothetical protein